MCLPDQDQTCNLGVCADRIEPAPFQDHVPVPVYRTMFQSAEPQQPGQLCYILLLEHPEAHVVYNTSHLPPILLKSFQEWGDVTDCCRAGCSSQWPNLLHCWHCQRLPKFHRCTAILTSGEAAWAEFLSLFFMKTEEHTRHPLPSLAVFSWLKTVPWSEHWRSSCSQCMFCVFFVNGDFSCCFFISLTYI